MQTIHGMSVLPLARFDGTLLGLDARWLGKRGLLLVLMLILATPAGPLNQDGMLPLWLRWCVGLSSVAAFVLTSLSHELGHAVAGRLAGLHVRAVVLAPHGSLTIRASSQHAAVNFWTALAGPLANAVLGGLCVIGMVVLGSGQVGLSSFLMELAMLQFLTALANLIPCGPFDGQRMVAAMRGA